MDTGTCAGAVAAVALLAAACSGEGTGAPDATVASRPPSGPAIAGCPVFPPDDPWNQDVSALPVDLSSDSYIARMEPDHFLRLGFGVEEYYGVPITIVPEDQPAVPIEFGTNGIDYSDESDQGPFPIPRDVHIQGGSREAPDPTDGDRHLVVVQEGTCRAFELYNTERTGDGFRVSSAVWWDLRSVSFPRRPPGWTAADGAGLPLVAGLVRWDEASSGAIRHAIRFTAPHARQAYGAPANHCGPDPDRSLPPFGARLRLKADFDLSPYSGAARAILEALRRYGMILADVGTPWTLGGTSDPGFSDAIHELRDHPIPGSAFEVVQLGDVHDGC